MAKNRKHGKIDALEPAVKAAVEEMILSSKFTYREIAEYIADSSGENVSQAAVCRYAGRLCEDAAAIHMAQENIRAIMRECSKLPDMDATEGIVRVMSSVMMSAVRDLSPEDLQKKDPLKLIKQASELVRAVSYKRSLDIKNREITETGFDAVKEKLFAGLESDNPELYASLAAYLDSKKEELTQ